MQMETMQSIFLEKFLSFKKSKELVKVLAWYDNEWGFSNRMLDTSLAMASVMAKEDFGVAA